MDQVSREKWIEQWRAGARELEAFRIQELRELDERKRARIVMSFTRIPTESGDKAPAEETSGLVIQQEIFRKALAG